MDSKLSAAQKALPSLRISSLLFQHHLLALPSCLLQATTLIPVLPKHATFFPLPARYLPSLLIHLPCSRPAVLKVWSVDLSGSLRPFHGVCAVKNYFHNTTNTLFSLFTLLMFALVAQKPWWVKPLSWQISRQWRHSVVIVVVFQCPCGVQNQPVSHQEHYWWSSRNYSFYLNYVSIPACTCDCAMQRGRKSAESTFAACWKPWWLKGEPLSEL